MSAGTPLLRVEGLDAWYGDFQALFDVSVSVAEGEAVAIIGANGAGKSTLLRAISGMVPIRSGKINFGGADLGAVPAHRIQAAVGRGDDADVDAVRARFAHGLNLATLQEAEELGLDRQFEVAELIEE